MYPPPGIFLGGVSPGPPALQNLDLLQPSWKLFNHYQNSQLQKPIKSLEILLLIPDFLFYPGLQVEQFHLFQNI